MAKNENLTLEEIYELIQQIENQTVTPAYQEAWETLKGSLVERLTEGQEADEDDIEEVESDNTDWAEEEEPIQPPRPPKSIQTQRMPQEPVRKQAPLPPTITKNRTVLNKKATPNPQLDDDLMEDDE